MTLLRDGLLSGRGVAVAGVGQVVRDGLTGLAARVEAVEVGALAADEERVGEWARERAPLHAVVFDARAFMAVGLGEALESAWLAVREVAVGALIPAEGPAKVVMISPVPGGGEHADGVTARAVCAGLENLARTLSVEWARYGITTAAVAVGPLVDEGDLAELVCFLCSGGGEYLSGCRLECGALSPSG